jgi:hypothetical protein
VMHEEIGGFDDVVVDADQNEIVNLAHGFLPENVPLCTL